MLITSVGRISGWAARRIIHVIRRNEPEQLTNRLEARGLGVEGEMRDTRRARMGIGTTKVLHRDVFMRHRLHHVRPRDEHVRAAAHHVREVGDGRRIHGATGTGAQDCGDLRDDTRRERVAKENVGVATQREHALLNARATRVVETDHRRAIAHGEVHDLADLLSERLGE